MYSPRTAKNHRVHRRSISSVLGRLPDSCGPLPDWEGEKDAQYEIKARQGGGQVFHLIFTLSMNSYCWPGWQTSKKWSWCCRRPPPMGSRWRRWRSSRWSRWRRWKTSSTHHQSTPSHTSYPDQEMCFLWYQPFFVQISSFIRAKVASTADVEFRLAQHQTFALRVCLIIILWIETQWPLNVVSVPLPESVQQLQNFMNLNTWGIGIVIIYSSR